MVLSQVPLLVSLLNPSSTPIYDPLIAVTCSALILHATNTDSAYVSVIGTMLDSMTGQSIDSILHSYSLSSSSMSNRTVRAT